MLSHDLGLSNIIHTFDSHRENLKIGSKSYEFMTMHIKILRVAKMEKSSFDMIDRG